MKKEMALASSLDFLMSKFDRPEDAQEYAELVSWVESSIKQAKDVMRGEVPLDMSTYEQLYFALEDLADWYRINVVYE
jgi:phosphoserine aminotransferase